MTPEQIQIAADWLAVNRAAITRVRPRLRGSIVSYIPRKGWGRGLAGAFYDAPGMWSSIEGPDPMDSLFRKLNISVDQPL